jgi:long-subunit fatty acid transport protein
MKKILLSIIAIISINAVNAQQKEAQFGFGFGGGAITNNASINFNWGLGLKKKFVIGTGLRYTGFYGKDIKFTSAPASLAGDAAKEDTLLAKSPSHHSVNLLINLAYKFNDNWTVGFDIDAAGFSFGSKGSPIFTSNGVNSTVASAKPTGGNLLLVGNNDKGQLNSTFYIHKHFGKKFGVRAGFQYLFTEITTSTDVQTLPEKNNRFRYKQQGVNISGIYRF